MAKSKTNNQTDETKDSFDKTVNELFEKNQHNKIDEIESDGSASAFDGTENVSEDNFDDLSEK